MFGFFRSKKKINTKSRIGITREAAFSDLVNSLNKNAGPDIVFYFFEESRESFERLLAGGSANTSGIRLINAKKFSAASLSLSAEKIVYCIDHYPLISVFRSFNEKISEANPEIELIIYGGLDEPIFNEFGGNRIRDLMVKLGMKPDELIEHSLVTKSIENAQEKIEKKITTESIANSAADWFKRNLTSPL